MFWLNQGIFLALLLIILSRNKPEILAKYFATVTTVCKYLFRFGIIVFDKKVLLFFLAKNTTSNKMPNLYEIGPHIKKRQTWLNSWIKLYRGEEIDMFKNAWVWKNLGAGPPIVQLFEMVWKEEWFCCPLNKEAYECRITSAIIVVCA